jgi:bacterioferritin-associated ferredoxin
MTENQENIIICRCADVTIKEIRALIDQGITDLDDIKRLSRAGMGQCQGKTCRNLILAEIAKAKGLSVDQIAESRYRPPAVAIPLGLLSEDEEENNE